jgi:hypothetical protein
MSSATRGIVSLFGADPATYAPHRLHAPTRVHRETNCYTDILIELLHAAGREPLAALGMTVRTDFEGDQFTFFKPPADELERLFGIDIHEMQPYRPLPEQLAELLAAGRTMVVELDAWHLPDTAATSYHREHVKTSVAVEAIDPAGERLRYFHNAGYFALEGEDYRGALRVGGAHRSDLLPPYAELVRFDAGPALTGEALRDTARGLLAEHLARRPRTNPFERFAARLEHDLPALLDGDVATYHAYAFATVRMAGASFELCAAHADWLLGAAAAEAVAAFGEIVDAGKVLSFKLARRRPFDPTATLDGMAAAWTRAMNVLDAAAG